ncbi:MAG: SDR family oxidoreductase [Pseudomonadota bacterium]|nr:SDR family oxidoreductase [Pseudomonadota bacterium]
MFLDGARCGRANAGLRWIYRAHRVGRCVAWRRRRRWSGRSSPGATETPMIGTYDNAVRDGAIARIALPEDIADVARFLIEDGSRFITGQIVPVNGGSAFG